MPRAQLVERWFAQFDELRAVSEEHGLPPLGGLTDVRETVKRCAPPLQVTVEDVSRIGDALAATHAVVQYLTAVPADSPPSGSEISAPSRSGFDR